MRKLAILLAAVEFMYGGDRLELGRVQYIMNLFN